MRALNWPKSMEIMRAINWPKSMDDRNITARHSHIGGLINF